MSELTALCYAAGALLLVLAGALKVADPSGTVGALRALGVEVDATRVRVLAGAELALGGLALAVSGAILALAVALSYVGFGLVVVAALVREVPIDSCGCLGRLETPPGGRHLVVIGIALFGAVGQVVEPSAPLLERLAQDGSAGVLFCLAAFVLAAGGVVLFRAGRRPSVPR